MSFAKLDAWVRKSKLAVHPRSFWPQRCGEALALAKAASQPSIPPHSASLALRADSLAFESRWHWGHPASAAAALYASVAVRNSDKSALALSSFWLLEYGFWGLSSALSVGLSQPLFSERFPIGRLPPLLPFLRAIAAFCSMRTSLRE